MNAIADHEMTEIRGGGPEAWIPTIIQLYKDTLTKIEQNPQDYTWTMDWYYQRGQTK